MVIDRARRRPTRLPSVRWRTVSCGGRTRSFAPLRSSSWESPTEAIVAYIDSHRDHFGVEPILHALEVATSTYYCATSRRPSARAISGSMGARPEGLVRHSDAGSLAVHGHPLHRAPGRNRRRAVDRHRRGFLRQRGGPRRSTASTNELIHRQGPWRNGDDVEVATAAGCTGGTPAAPQCLRRRPARGVRGHLARGPAAGGRVSPK